jgi:hypothetical protein
MYKGLTSGETHSHADRWNMEFIVMKRHKLEHAHF